MSDSPAASDQKLRMSYRIGRGEVGVLTFEPYKSFLLPMWRFRTPDIARESSEKLYAQFIAYDGANDFVGMDMTRKFIQMGMTRAKRYANYKGGRKYARRSGSKVLLDKSNDHKDMADKQEASSIFRGMWDQCRNHKGYQRKKKEFLEEQRKWDLENRS